MEVPMIDRGDTAWILTSTALVLFMTIPGLSLFYAGLVRTKNVLSVLMQCFVLTALMTLLWLAYGYSVAFDTTGMQAGVVGLNSFVGTLGKAFLSGVGVDSISGTIPEPLFFAFQMTFAIITPALIVGAFAERMKFSAMLWFMVGWLTLVYLPVCHMTWGGPGGVLLRSGRARLRGRHRRAHHGGRRRARGRAGARRAARLADAADAASQPHAHGRGDRHALGGLVRLQRRQRARRDRRCGDGARRHAGLGGHCGAHLDGDRVAALGAPVRARDRHGQRRRASPRSRPPRASSGRSARSGSAPRRGWRATGRRSCSRRGSATTTRSTCSACTASAASSAPCSRACSRRRSSVA